MKFKVEMPPVMICGGKGTSLGNVTRFTPKPMVKIGNAPIVWHIMQWYASFGCHRFILCLGYLKSSFQDYFKKRQKALAHLGWEVTPVDRGAETSTGGRVYRAAKVLRKTDKGFFMTYGVGVADVDIAKLLKRRRAAKRAITISAVHPASRFGELVINGDKVTDFHEKGIARYYISSGFTGIDRKFNDPYLTSDTKMFFEQKPMHTAAAKGSMTVYRHEGFWQCMPPPREHALLNELWTTGRGPWKTH